MSNFKVSQLPASAELAVEDILPLVDVSEMLTKKAEVGDLIDLAANTIESMPNLIVDPENNFTNFSQAVRTQIVAGDGITYTSATGEVKLTNKSITINGNTVNLGGSTTIPVGTTYTNGTGINIVGTQINALQFSVNGVAGNLGTNISIPVGTTTTLSSGGTFPSNLSFSPSTGNITAALNANPTFFSITAVKNNAGNSEQTATSYAASFQSTITQSALVVQASSSNSIIPAVLITNTGIGNSFEIRDQSGDTSPFAVSKDGLVTMGGVGAGSTVVLSPNGSVLCGIFAHTGSYLNTSIFWLNTDTTLDRTHNLIYAKAGASGSSNVTGTLPPLDGTNLGVEYTFRKFTDASMQIKPTTGDKIEFVANLAFTMTSSTNITVKLKAIEHLGVRTWIVYDIFEVGSFGSGGGFITVPP